MDTILDVRFMPKGNRSIIKANKARIERSMRRNGILGTILAVNTDIFGEGKHWYIIDGQHRYMAAKSLNRLEELKVDFLKTEITSLQALVNLVAELNNSSRGWEILDYVNIYTAIGNEEYKKLKDYSICFSIHPSAALYLLSNYSSISKCSRKIKEGNIEVIDNTHNKNLLTLTSYLLSLLDNSEMTQVNLITKLVKKTFNDCFLDVEKTKTCINDNLEMLKQCNSEENFITFLNIIK